MRAWIVLTVLCVSFLLAASADARCGRARAVCVKAKNVAGKVVNGVRRVLPPWR